MPDHAADEDGAVQTGREPPPTSHIVKAVLLVFVLGGLIQGGPNWQTKLVLERGLSWEEAGHVFYNAFTILTLGIFFLSVIGLPARTCAAVGLALEIVGFAVVAFSTKVLLLSVGLGLVGLGGTAVYISALQLAETSIVVAACTTAYNSSAYVTYFLLIPEFSLRDFCFVWCVLSTGAIVVVWEVLPSKAEEIHSFIGVQGFRSPRYWAFCTAFGLCAAGVTWSIGAYNGTVSETLDKGEAAALLTALFPFVANATLLSAPPIGFFADRFGCLGPGVLLVFCTQVLLACFMWPSELTFYLALIFSNVTNSAVYTLQATYLLTFAQSEFAILLSGTILVQALVLFVLNAGPTSGAGAAGMWFKFLFLGYLWPIVHALHLCSGTRRGGQEGHAPWGSHVSVSVASSIAEASWLCDHIAPRGEPACDENGHDVRRIIEVPSSPERGLDVPQSGTA
eukprot:TRINITY_DN47008_c0_g1_i1.p1 TRINITY_DN47008_c0_g1~~TRINITY_DN47008_c0_g1_i1.p1  ORF type:complete len:452 (-),score=60.52 TRINITY_DN47008_c0_g1_i1:124-1479(-)